MNKSVFLIFFSCFASSCTTHSYHNATESIEEFVLDSYKIQQGKFSILEMQGCKSSPLPAYCLQEIEAPIDEMVMLMGAIEHPQVPINGRTRLLEVLTQASLHPNANLFRSYILRKENALAVDFYRLIYLGDMSQNIVIHPGDKIYIAPASEAHITVCAKDGEISIIPVPNGYISIREALGAAGIGHLKTLQVVRNSPLKSKVFKLTSNHISLLPNSSLLLMADDTLKVLN